MVRHCKCVALARPPAALKDAYYYSAPNKQRASRPWLPAAAVSETETIDGVKQPDTQRHRHRQRQQPAACCTHCRRSPTELKPKPKPNLQPRVLPALTTYVP